jgi:cellulose synthase/poly-beta-1,6-N-acetylglucosamine synthase-like glycosyltransferase
MVPFVTVAMPCFEEEAYVEACLASVFAQDYPADRFEVLVVDGGSTDRTRAILAALASREPRLRVLDNPKRLQAPALNRALEAARGEVLVRMDVHCEYAPDYVRRAVEELERTGAANVGGAQRAKAKTPFQRALVAALASPLAVGGARYRDASAEGFVDTVFLGTFRVEALRALGGWDEAAATNEDAELNQRILAAGGRIYLSRAIVVHYYPRASLRALYRQYHRYGIGRARTTLKHRGLPTLRPMAPFLLVTAAVVTATVPPLRPLFLVGAVVYGVACLAESARVGRGLDFGERVACAACFPVIHAAHGLGFATGLLRSALGRESVF